MRIFTSTRALIAALALALGALIAGCSHGQLPDPPAPKSIDGLKIAIEAILLRNHIPRVGSHWYPMIM